MRTVPFDQLAGADLILDAVYEGGNAGGIADDPLSKLLPGCRNQGGFRIVGGSATPKYVVLYTSGEDPDWPDDLDVYTGRFDYYGDNRSPGKELHETSIKGNFLLKNVFETVHSADQDRSTIPPFLVFAKYPTENSARSVQFKGLAAPGFESLPATDDLIAVWKSKDQQRFQNYRAVFTILDVSVISKTWLEGLSKLSPSVAKDAPPVWLTWVGGGKYDPLEALPTKLGRSEHLQRPKTRQQEEIVNAVYNHFKDAPTSFEAFASRVYEMHEAPRVTIDLITRPSRDGGRDALGRYRLGVQDDPIYLEFALEAKCWSPGAGGKTTNRVGVKEVQRLISRLKHRQFGVLVTTSSIAQQAYTEVREDGHPVIFICGRDMPEILIEKGINSAAAIKQLLEREYPGVAT